MIKYSFFYIKHKKIEINNIKCIIIKTKINE